ncbi:MAG: hypothetical protein RR744_00530 [Cellulosilyticaceae bacterium]
MLKMFLVGLGAGYVVFTKNGNEIIKKYMNLSNDIAHKSIDVINSIVPKGDVENEHNPIKEDE